MRGKPSPVHARVHGRRIIPAHAGQTDGEKKKLGAGSDHPRTCGANSVVVFLCPVVVGSSPHMRGKPITARHIHVRRRIIPAHAGQTTPLSLKTYENSDHPRTCGANLATLKDKGVGDGSSPHMRGKRKSSTGSRTYIRIIPAHAGQTSPSASSWISSTDHPRTCGANEVSSVVAIVVTGSSPHMRGKPCCAHWACGSARIIPAHAGQTRSYAGRS